VRFEAFLSLDCSVRRQTSTFTSGKTVSTETVDCVNLSKDKALRPKYAAISHVWGVSKAVRRISESANRPLRIYKEAENADHSIIIGDITICWQGLVEAAQAARFCGCDYLWLDLFCIDQRRTDDKRMQIKNMGNIYELATVVIVMVGGAGAVQGIDEGSSWIDRAWTLQEAVVCPNTTVLVKWPQHWPGKFNAPPVCRDPGDDPNRFHVEFKRIQGTDLALVDMKVLLHLQLTAGQIIVDVNGKQGPVKLQPNFAIRCFDSGLHDPVSDTLSLSAGRLALVAVLEASEKSADGKINKEMKHCAVWRSMHLRISTNQEDIVLSILHLLDVNLDGTKDADLTELYQRLVQRVAINGIPAWLGIGGSSGDIIPRNLTSGIYPELPIRQKREDSATETELPKYQVGGHPLPVTKFISRSGDYISEFDILFKNWGSTDPYVCCTMLEFESSPIDTFKTLSSDAGEYKYSRLKNPHITGILTYKSSWVSANRGVMAPRLQVMFIGRVQWLERFSLPVREPDHSSWYVYIVRRDHAGWVRVGSGMCAITDGELPDDRKHLVFGQQLKVRDLEWDCECNNRPVRQSTGQRSTTQPRPLDCPQCGWNGSSAKGPKDPHQENLSQLM
jgi:Heterokaryon incompatibility protein (HET)